MVGKDPIDANPLEKDLQHFVEVPRIPGQIVRTERIWVKRQAGVGCPASERQHLASFVDEL
jgi:hypothetical protein